MIPNTLTWRQEVIGEVLPVFIPLLVALVALAVAKLTALTQAITIANNQRRDLFKTLADNHTDVLEAVKNGPANVAAREAAENVRS